MLCCLVGRKSHSTFLNFKVLGSVTLSVLSSGTSVMNMGLHSKVAG